MIPIVWDIWILAGLASGATGANIYGARHGNPNHRQLRSAIAGLAAFYAIGYFWLALDLIDRLTWSRFYGRVGFLAWPLVWILPPLIGVHANRTIGRVIKETLLEDDEP